jgi:hypothetical protein
MRQLARLSILLLPLAAAACSPGMIVMRQPQTGQLAECRTKWPEMLHVRADTEPCAADYQKLGYARMIP